VLVGHIETKGQHVKDWCVETREVVSIRGYAALDHLM
jgi:hypothetical protein